MDREEEYADFSNVVKQHNFLTAEEFPEGPFGSPEKLMSRWKIKALPGRKASNTIVISPMKPAISTRICPGNTPVPIRHMMIKM